MNYCKTRCRRTRRARLGLIKYYIETKSMLWFDVYSDIGTMLNACRRVGVTWMNNVCSCRETFHCVFHLFEKASKTCFSLL